MVPKCGHMTCMRMHVSHETNLMARAMLEIEASYFSSIKKNLGIVIVSSIYIYILTINFKSPAY